MTSEMTAFDWFLIGWWTLSILLMVNNVGKPRKPLEPSAAAVASLIILGLMAGLLVSRGVL